MGRLTLLLLSLACWISAVAATTAAESGSLQITEFMASNGSLLLDDAGQSSDWVEIFNPGPESVSASGWSLTDDPGNLQKWSFPELSVGSGAYLIVFASGSDHRDPTKPLHTNFKLSASGGFLALVKPDGQSIASRYNYGPQRVNISSGLRRVLNPTPYFAATASWKAWFPTNDLLGLGWTGADPNFSEQAWGSVQNGLGFDSQLTSTEGLIAWWDFNESSNRTAVFDVSGGQHHGKIVTGPVYSPDKGGRTGASGDRALQFPGGGSVQVPDAATGMFSPLLAHNAETISVWLFGSPAQPAATTAFYGSEAANGGGNRSIEAHVPWSDGTIYWDTGGCCDESLHRVSVHESNPDNYRGRWNHYAFVKDGKTKEIWQNGVRILQGTSTAPQNVIRSFMIGGFGDGSGNGYLGSMDDFTIWDHALSPEQIQALASGVPPNGINSLRPWIREDVASQMQGRTAAVYLRGSWVMQGDERDDWLALRIRYKDGFIAWLNGTEVARRNVTGAAGFTALAASERTRVTARLVEEIDISSFVSLLHPGTNVLAIEGLNSAASQPDFLLEAQMVSGRSSGEGVFLHPTPGKPNDEGSAGFVSEVVVSPGRGVYRAPLTVQLSCNTPGSRIVYTLDGSEPAATPSATSFINQGSLVVTQTTVIRATAFLDGRYPSLISTHTYVLPETVPQQNRPIGVPTTWPGGYANDFAIDPRVVTNALPGYSVTEGLVDLPSVSLVLPPDLLWGAARGIYANPLTQVEQVGSFEYLPPTGLGKAHAPAGLSIRGQSSESNDMTPKHSFNIAFRGDYGAADLHGPLFPDTSVDLFNSVVLRGNVLDSWVNAEAFLNHSIDGELRWYRTRASYVRDQWMRDSQLAMGHLASHGRFVHVYLNGLYWGIYNLDERVDDTFAARYLGGNPVDYDFIADSELKAGTMDAWNQLISLAGANLTNPTNYQRLMGNFADGTRNPATPVLLNITNLVDYMILHIYAGADDWPWHNWMALRKRTPDSTGFQFLPWDQEISINSLVKQHTDAGDPYAEVSVAHTYIYSRCRLNPDFRQFFADRVQKHLFGSGVLSVASNQARYATRTSEIDHAIVAESARWGDYYRPTRPYLREKEWLGTNQWMQQVYFPSNHFIALKRFRDASLFPTLTAPQVRIEGSAGPVGFSLQLNQPNTNANAILYYTLDGSDPRRPGGAVSTGALIYSNALAISPSSRVMARVFRAGQWSPLTDLTFIPPQSLNQLRITEVMYHPDGPTDAEQDAAEFLELQNQGTDILDLSGAQFTRGITFAFPKGFTLNPGAFCVLVRDGAGFSARHPGVAFHGTYTGRLSNAGETLEMIDAGGTIVLSLDYGTRAPWPVTPDGFGFSLVARRTSGDASSSEESSAWRASTRRGGSPGTVDPDPEIAEVVIEECLRAPVGGGFSAVELRNRSSFAADLGGWILTTDLNTLVGPTFPASTILPPYGTVVVEPARWPGWSSWSLPASNAVVYLVSRDASGLTGYSHAAALEPIPDGATRGRYLNSRGQEEFPLQQTPTLGGPNSSPMVGPLVITEIAYYPPFGEPPYIECLNRTAQPLALYEIGHPEQTWMIDGLSFRFPSGLALPPGARVVISSVTPEVFRSAYSIPDDAMVLGPYGGTLSTSGERLRILRPLAAGEASGLATATPLWVPVDEVTYGSNVAWPFEANGLGEVLQRVDLNTMGNDPALWVATAPSPGSAEADSDGDGVPDWWEIREGTSVSRPDAGGDPDGDGFDNKEEYLAGTHPLDPESHLALIGLETSPLLRLRFQGSVARHYTLWESSTLADPARWIEVPSGVENESGRLSIEIPSSEKEQRFFRLTAP